MDHHVGIAEQDCILETALAVEALRVNREPAARPKIEDAIVVDVAVQDAHLLRVYQEDAGRFGSARERTAMRPRRRL